MTPQSLPADFHDYVTNTVDAEGWPVSPGWILNAQGELTVMALAVPPPQVYRAMLMQIAKLSATAFVFAIDRYAKPDQGTTRSDLLAGLISIDGPRGIRPFIIEYDPVKRVVDPINYDNAFWNRALHGEWHGMLAELGSL